MLVNTEAAFAIMENFTSTVLKLGTFAGVNACLQLSKRIEFSCTQSVSFFIIFEFGCSLGYDSTANSIVAHFEKVVAI